MVEPVVRSLAIHVPLGCRGARRGAHKMLCPSSLSDGLSPCGWCAPTPPRGLGGGRIIHYQLSHYLEQDLPGHGQRRFHCPVYYIDAPARFWKGSECRSPWHACSVGPAR